jgi:hypothetical protein
MPALARHTKDIHRDVEKTRSRKEGPIKISDQAYVQVFSMLIEYGILGFEYLHRRKMSQQDRETYFDDMRSVALMMEIRDFPEDYRRYVTRRNQMVASELQRNAFTLQLMDAYRKHLPRVSYWGLLQFQARFIHPILASRLNLKTNRFFEWLYWIYPRVRFQPLFNRCFALMLNLPDALS